MDQEKLEQKYKGYKLSDDILISTDMKTIIMGKIHKMRYSGYIGYQKMIASARKRNFWYGIKKDVAEYNGQCMECQQVNPEQQHPAGFL